MASSGGLDLITIFLIPLVTHINFAIALDCYRGSPCCILWNEDLNICSDCKVGYIGENCDSPCRYPSYGVDCQLECFCNESYCNHKHGCRGNRDRPMEAQAESKLTYRCISLVTRCLSWQAKGYGKYYRMKVEDIQITNRDQSHNSYKQLKKIESWANPDPWIYQTWDQVPRMNTHATNRCKSTEDTKGRKVLVYLTVVLGMVGLLQLAVYIGLSVLYEPRVLTSKRPSQIAQKTRT